MQVYLAAPFRTDAERIRIREVEVVLSSREWPGIGSPIEVYLPMDHMILKPDSSFTDQRDVFNENVRAILASRAMVAILDERDSGTIWEMGKGHNKMPVIGLYCSPQSRINVMLTHGCKFSFLGIDRFRAWLDGNEMMTWHPPETR